MANISQIKVGNTNYNLKAIDDYATCGSAADVVAKTATTSSGFALTTGRKVTVKFTNGNTANNMTLNIDSTGAKAVYLKGSSVANNIISAGDTVDLIYNGTQYDIVGIVSSGGGGGGIDNGFYIGTSTQSATASKLYFIHS